MFNEYRLRAFVLQVVMLAAVLTAVAQDTYKYTGIVRDLNGGLTGAELLNPTDKSVIAFTDSMGLFQLESSLTRVEVSMLGYYTIQVELSEGYNTIMMLPEANLLDQLVVSEGKSAKMIKKTTISMQLIKPDLIDQTAPMRIQESINRINGVQIVDNQANIRSGSGWSYGAGSRVQVLVDGIPMLSGDANQPQWTFIPTEGIENVEIIKGAASVIYGSSALNGVINIKTKTHGTEPFTQLSFTTGIYDLPSREGLYFNGKKRYNLSNLSAFHLGKMGSLDFHLGLNMMNDQGYKMSDAGQRARTTFGIKKINGEKHRIIGVNTGFQMGKSTSFLLWESYEQAYTGLDSGVTENQSLRLSIDPYISWYSGKVEHKINTRYLKVSNDVDNGDSAVDQSNFSDWAFAEYQAKRTFSKLSLNALGGVVGQMSQTRSPLFSGTQNTRNAAAYFQLEKTWGKLLINGGVRYEYFKLNEREEAKPVLRAGLNYELSKATFLRASYGQGYRFPSVAEAFVATTVGPVTIYPNPDLESETGSNLELGLRQGFAIRNVKAFVDVAYYRMRFNRMSEFLFASWSALDINSGDLGIGFKAINAGETQVSGAEISIALEGLLLGGTLSGFVGYNYNEGTALNPDDSLTVDFYNRTLTYRNTSSTTNGKNLKYRPNHSLKSDIIWKYKKWNLGFGMTYQSEFKNIDTSFVSLPITAFVPGVDSAMNDGLTSYLTFNARLGYQVYKELRVNLIVSNIGNREYMIRPADIGPPRTFRLQISYTFK
ncbi:MAG: TonB-dependent receptor [Bacteroidia bacterium]